MLYTPPPKEAELPLKVQLVSVAEPPVPKKGVSFLKPPPPEKGLLDALPVTAGGHDVYGVSISPGMGYRNNRTSGVAVKGKPEGMYMVSSGTHFNSECCFDYGDAETSGNDTGAGHMDAVSVIRDLEWPDCRNGPAEPAVGADLATCVVPPKPVVRQNQE